MAKTAATRRARERADASDMFLGVTVRVGQRLYHQLKDAAPGDAAQLLRGYADRSTGAVRAMFLMLAEWQGLVHLNPLVEAPDPFKAKATDGCDVTVGLCGPPCPSTQQMPVYQNNVFQYCTTCLIEG